MKHADYCARVARPNNPLERGFAGKDRHGKPLLVAAADCTCGSSKTASLLQSIARREADGSVPIQSEEEK